MSRRPTWFENSGADIVNLSGDGQDTTITHAAEAGKRHYVKKVIGGQTDSGQVINYRVYQGDELTGDLVAIVTNRSGAYVEIDLEGMAWPENTAVTVQAEAIGAANNVTLFVEGWTL